MVAMDSAAVERVLQRVAEDGTVENEQVLSDDAIEIGRTSTDFACPDDSEMAARHAQVRVQGGTAVVSDSGEGSGVWLRVVGSKGRILDLGDQVWLGAQILPFPRQGS